MGRLDLGTYIDGIGDPERGRYLILAGLQETRRAFNAIRLYPDLAELVELYRTLTKILEAGSSLIGHGSIVGLDVKSQRVLYNHGSVSGDESLLITEFIRWSLPLLRETIEEGRTIHNFIEEQTRLDEVGLVPGYTDEGYLLVPDLLRGLIVVIRYETSIYTEASERFRHLKTSIVSSHEIADLKSSPWSIKQRLIREYDLPNPATFALESESGFPFQETLLPIARRKLLRHLTDGNA